MMAQSIVLQRFSRTNPRIVQQPFERLEQLRPGDQVHFHTPKGTMDLSVEDIEVGGVTYRCGRVFRMALHPPVPRGKGFGTGLHRAVELRCLELGLVFATADDKTLDRNPVTTALHDRLLELYETADAGNNCFLLLKPRAVE